MAYFEWAADLEIDQGPIDADHRKLVAQVNQLHDATSQGRGQDIVGPLLAELVQDTVQHIQREERYLESIGFPETPAHRQGHERFVNELRALQGKYDAGQITVAAQLSALLRDWLSLHIRRSDKAVKHFLDRRAREARRLPRS